MRVHINPSVTVLLWSPPDHGIVRVGQKESHGHDTQVVLNILERGGVETVTFPSIRCSPLFFSFFFFYLDKFWPVFVIVYSINMQKWKGN